MGMASFQFERNKKKFILGIGAGMIQQSTFFDKLRLVNSTDATFTQQQSNLLIPSLQLSTVYLSTDFFVSVNSKAVFQKQLSDPSQTHLVNHTYVSGGLKFKLYEHITAIPSALVRVSSSTANTADIGGLLDYKDQLRFGMLYRTNGDFSATVGCTYSHFISVLYSYDITTSQLRNSFGNTHNLVISIRMKKSIFSSGMPTHFWL
jgi:type IX secretion system PorP/SprF family membrane protein